jgi:DMSO/TMAO reductase YedYZ molybdopterin-dependent catalytic subunit
MQVSRRHFLGALGAAGLLRPQLVSAGYPGKSPNMVELSAEPPNMEMALEGFNSWITPVEDFYVRCNSPVPAVEISQYRLTLDGLVDRPLTLTMEDLSRMPKVSLVSVVECAGNGRKNYSPKISGSQWNIGAVGNARWAGVRLADILKRAGVKTAAKHAAFDGLDQPEAGKPDFQRSIDVGKALHRDTLLAYEMNGQPLRAEHGYPIRVVTPGWTGNNWVKWVTRITLREDEVDNFFQRDNYRYPLRPVPPGSQPVDPMVTMAPVTALMVKSVISTPVNGARLPLREVKVSGAAWSDGLIARVEVSTDAGRHWHPATLGSDSAPYSWRLWEYRWKPSGPGYHTLMARAEDAKGNRQPLVPEWNPLGYYWNVVQIVSVNIEG